MSRSATVILVVSVATVANLPALAAFFDHRGVFLSLVRLYPGQFAFLAVPFLGAAVLTFCAWSQACNLWRASGNTSTIPRYFRPGRGVVFGALAAGMIISGLAALTERPVLYVYPDSTDAILEIDDFLEASFRDPSENLSPVSARQKYDFTVTDSPMIHMVVLEFIELTAVVFTAYTLFAACVLLSLLSPHLERTDQAKSLRRGGLFLFGAIACFLIWPPLRAASIEFMSKVRPPNDLERINALMAVWGVLIAIFFAGVFTALVFVESQFGRLIVGAAIGLFGGGATYLVVDNSQFVYAIFGSVGGFCGFLIMVVVTVIALSLIIHFFMNPPAQPYADERESDE